MRCAILMLFVGVAANLVSGQAPSAPNDQRAEIPRTWDDRAIEAAEVPLADARSNRKHVSADFYYRMPVRRVLKSYPIYHPAFEPTIDGKPYRQWLESQMPQEILSDFSTLRTEADWRSRGPSLGKDVFEAPLALDDDPFLSIVRLGTCGTHHGTSASEFLTGTMASCRSHATSSPTGGRASETFPARCATRAY